MAPRPDQVPHRLIITLCTVGATLMQALDQTIANVALPYMQGSLSATTDEITWVLTSYITAAAIMTAPVGWLAARFGRKYLFITCLIGFTVTSMLCGAAQSLPQMVLFRVLQGVFGAALVPLSQSTMMDIYPVEKRGQAMAIWGMGVMIGPILGPTLGGWITDNYTWNWCFFINIPIGIASFFLVTTFLDDSVQASKAGTIDWWGIGLLAVGLGSLQYVLEEGQSDDWFNSKLILRLTILSVVSIAALMWWELSPKNEHPVVNFRILKNRALSSAIFLFVALGFGLYGGIYLFPLFAQTILGLTPTKTGLTLLPGGLATAASALICGRLLNGKRALVDPRVLIVIGVAIFMLSMWKLGHLTTLSGEDDTRFALLIRGFGLGFLFTPINQVAYASINPREAQQASGLINLSRQMGGSFGIALLGTFLNNRADTRRANLVSYVYDGNPQLMGRVNGLAANFHAHGYSMDAAKKAAMAVVDRSVNVQALTSSYNDSFILILIVFMCTAPAIFLLKKAKTPTGPIDAH